MQRRPETLTLSLWIFFARRQPESPRNATLLNLWKNPDPDLLLLKQAKAEYAKLQ